MEKEYLIDTNVFIDIMADRYAPSILDKLRKIIAARFFISIVNKIELLEFHLQLPDTIIAASALSVDATVLTNNTTDFRKICNLTVLSPQQLIPNRSGNF